MNIQTLFSPLKEKFIMSYHPIIVLQATTPAVRFNSALFFAKKKKTTKRKTSTKVVIITFSFTPSKSTHKAS